MEQQGQNLIALLPLTAILNHPLLKQYLYSFALIDEEGFLISSCYSLELHIQMLISFLFSFAFRFSSFSQLFVRPPQTAILPFCISFPWGWSWSLSPVQCHEPPSLVYQALYLSDLVPWIYFSLPLYNHKGFRSYLNGLVVFPTFFNFSLNLAIRSSQTERQSAPGLVFADCIELLHLWLQRI